MTDAPTTIGRPSLYRPEHCDTVRELLAQGYNLTVAAGRIGVSRQTCYAWMDEQPDFLDAVNVGRAIGQGVWAEMLMHQARTGDGNTAAIIFAMKNLYRDDWNDRTAVDHTSSDGTMTPQKIMRVVVDPSA